jgi:hypothetical protein
MPDRRSELRDQLTTAHDELLQMLDSLNTTDWEQQTYEGWSRKDTFAHLATIQARQRAQVQCALDGSSWNPEDVNVYNARKVEERKAWSADQVRNEYEQELSATVDLLDKVSEADLQRTYVHPTRGLRTIESVFEQVVSHTQGHAADIMAAKQGATP